MADEEQEDLLIQGSEDDEDADLRDSLTLSEHSSTPSTYTVLKVAGLAVILMITTATTVVLLPIYLETVNVSGGDVYTSLLFTTTGSFILFLISASCLTTFYKSMFSLPSLRHVIRSSGLYTLAGILVLYAVDRKRVSCHIQDPLKGIVLVFALVYYFFFCKKVVGLHQLFSCTLTTIGLFICSDYALCDVYRCRGTVRETQAEDVGIWTKAGHAAWLVAYIIGLALWTLAAGSLLEENLQPVASNDHPSLKCNHTYGVIKWHMWIHGIAVIFVLMMCWTDLLPGIAKESDSIFMLQWHGLLSHFSSAPLAAVCWPWLLSYCIMSALICTMIWMGFSSILVLATAAAGLPLVSIWWALFRMNLYEEGQPEALGYDLVSWSPSLVTGETVSVILGFPVVLAGLVLGYRAHFQEECQNSCRFRFSNEQANGA